jgi:putative hemolysin
MPQNNQSLSLCHDSGAKAHQQHTTARSADRLPGDQLLNWLPGGRVFKAANTAAASNSWDDGCPFDYYLRQLNVDLRVSEIDLRRFPRQGPLIVVANHPYGGLDGLMLGAIMARARADFKLLANHYLSAIAAIGDAIIPVDVFGGRLAKLHNMRPLRQAIDWVRSGGCLGIFPAGEVSRFRPTGLGVTDRTWGSHVGALLRLSKASIVPVYFPGRNSALFSMASMLHPILGTLLLPRELLRCRGRTFRAIVGQARPWSRMAAFGSDADVMRHLRNQTYFLSHRLRSSGPFSGILSSRGKWASSSREILRPIPKRSLQEEIHALPPSQKLTQQGRFSVYYTDACQTPHLVQEIGRLREITFREVGEGTGQAIDLDCFDAHYQHLFLWNNEHAELAGAYRLGLTDRVLSSFGPKGLYTTTLFHFKPALLKELTPAIELGRAFIRSSYQRHHACLFLLWRGIGQFIVRHPQYYKLFGPVSISRDYQKISRELMIGYLRTNTMHQRLARLIKPRHPVRIRSRRSFARGMPESGCHTPEDISILVSELEEDGKGLPVLLRQYLKLDATLLCFNLDPSFADVVDGLAFLDLTCTSAPMIKRVMGSEGYRQFCNYHDLTPEAPPQFRKTG